MLCGQLSEFSFEAVTVAVITLVEINLYDMIKLHLHGVL